MSLSLSPELDRAHVVECLVRSPVVVPVDPAPDGVLGMGEAAEVVLPDALLLEASEEAFDEPVLLRRVGRHELLLEAVVAAGGSESLALEDEAVVASDDGRGSFWSKRSKTSDASCFKRTFCFPGAAA